MLRSLRSINFHDQAVAQAEREIQAERERGIQQLPDYEAFLANVALRGLVVRGLVPRRLESVEDSESSDTQISEDPYHDDYDWRRDMESYQDVPEHERPDHELPTRWEHWMHEQDPANHEFPAHFAEVQLPVGDHSPSVETHGQDDPMIMQTLRWQAEALREQAERAASSDEEWLAPD